MEYALEESLEISTVLNTKNQYVDWMAQHQSLQIDASQVVRIDAAGIQLLASMFITARKSNVDIHLVEVPTVLSEGIRLLGFELLFGLEKDIEDLV